MITGKVLPERERLYAVFRVLCDMAEVDPDAERWEEDGGYNYPDPESNWQYLRRLWDTALEDESDAPPLPRPAPATAATPTSRLFSLAQADDGS